MLGIGATRTTGATAGGLEPPARLPAPGGRLAVAAAPALIVVALLLVAAWFDGGSATRSWAPLAVFALVSLAAARLSATRGPALVMVAALWLFALWSLASAAWSHAPGEAVEAGARNLLYAALVSLPVLTLPTREWAVRAGRAATAGLAALVLATLVACLIDGAGLFLAGRLDAPVGYRNGTAALFALAFWPLAGVAAARRAHAVVRAACFALAVTALGLAFLTQSRGVVVGFACGAAVALALGPDRLRRAWVAVLAVGAVAVASGALLRPWDAFVETSTTVGSAVDDAAGALALLALVTFAIALPVALLDGGLRLTDRRAEHVRRAGAAALAVLALAALGAALARIGDPVAFADDKAREFREVTVPTPGETRLGSTGGHRYDLWRIGWEEFRSAPVVGVGEGGYAAGYYVGRRTDRNVTDPHSLGVKVLAENGLVGALLLSGFLAAATVALASGWRSATATERRWASGLAAAGAAFVGQAFLDWVWLIPGVAGLGLVCLATAVAIVSLPRAACPARGRGARAARAVPVLAAVVVALLYVSDLHVRSARAATVPAGRLSDARTAARLNPFSPVPLHLQAGALEALGRRDDARAALLEALDVEPRSFATMALLGDLETRAGDDAAARAWYRRALALNPRDVGLQELAN
jgi:O-antigen ligase/polysaccharide polymerase Wzy-like membrane protein